MWKCPIWHFHSLNPRDFFPIFLLNIQEKLQIFGTDHKIINDDEWMNDEPGLHAP